MDLKVASYPTPRQQMQTPMCKVVENDYSVKTVLHIAHTKAP